MLLCLLVCLLWVFTDFVSATYIESTDKRLAVELEANVLIHPSSDEPRFSDSITNCFIDRVINTGFTVVLPGFARGQKGKDGLVVNATFVDQMTVICHVPQLITTGNTSIVPGNGSDGRFSAAFFESFAILSPAYGRRPYVRESNGSIVLQLDQSFLNSPVTPLALCVTVPQNESLGCVLSLSLPPAPRRAFLRLPFRLDAMGLPRTTRADTLISLAFPASAVPPSQRGSTNGTTLRASHPRVFARAPLPRPGSTVRVWQVDHAAVGGVLRVDGTPFVSNGWFGGGYDHESAGLPPRLVLPRPGSHDWTRSTFDPSRPVANSSGGGPNATTPLEAWTYTQAALGQSSRFNEWAKHGLTFARTGLGWKPRDDRLRPDGKADARWHPDWNDVLLGLDAAAAAGIPVLVNIGVDTLAMANASITHSTTSANTDLTACGDDESKVDPSNPPNLCAWVREAVKRLRDHPGLGGYYGCDDCCHVGSAAATHHREYNAIAALHKSLFSLDPYHLVYGTVACGATWMWQEEGAGLGLDVVLKEAYSGGVGSTCGRGDTPHQDADDVLCRGFYRSHPMTFEPFQSMPSPGAIRAPRAVRSHAYRGLVTEQSHSNNFYVYNNGDYNAWPLNHPVQNFAVEVSEMGLSLIDASANLFSLPPGATHGPICRARALSLRGGSHHLSSPNDNNNGGDPIFARWWFEGDLSRPCAHLVAVNTGARPTLMRVHISDLHLPNPPPTPGVVLERIFEGGGGGTCSECVNPYALYAVNLTLDHTSASASFEDFIDGQATNVYRYGCDVSDSVHQQHTKDTPAVKNGGWEEVNLAMPTIVSQGLSGLGGHSASWSLSADTFTDDRVRLRVSNMLPRSGRHCGEVNLATGRQVNMTVRLSFPTTPEGLKGMGSGRDYRLRLWARSSPPGAKITVVQETMTKPGAKTGGKVMLETWTKGDGKGDGEGVPGTVVGVEWVQVEASVVLGSNASVTAPIVVGMRGPSQLGGTVFIDDVQLVQ